MIIISETAPYAPLTSNPKKAEEVRTSSIAKELALFGKYPWIGGVLYWCYAPFRSHLRLGHTKLTVPVPTTETTYGTHDFVDQNRQRQPVYFAFRKDNSPADIKLKLLWPKGETAALPPTGFTAIIRRHGPDHIPSYPLDHYQAVWRVVNAGRTEVGAGEQTLPVIGPPFTLEKNWNPPANAKELTLHLWLYRPTGFLAAKGTCRWKPGIWNRGLWRCTSN